MPSDRVYISARVPKETAHLLEQIREALQAERPDTLVTKSDALRHCIHSLSGTAAISVPTKPLKLEGDKSGSGQEKG